jgi:DNA replication protein
MYQCEKCRDTGYVDIERDGRRYAKGCECLEVKRAEKRLKNSGLTEAFRQCRFDNTEVWNRSVKACLEKAKEYVQTVIESPDRRPSFMLLGQVGAGKTHVGVAIANALMAKKVGVVYWHYKELMRELKGNCMDQEAYGRILGRLIQVPVLFVDDAFKGRTDADIKYMYDIVNERYLRKKPVILTSELTAKELLEVDEAIGSRLIEMGEGWTHTFPNDSRHNFRLRSLMG